jgi:hypothetical protein
MAPLIPLPPCQFIPPKREKKLGSRSGTTAELQKGRPPHHKLFIPYYSTIRIMEKSSSGFKSNSTRKAGLTVAKTRPRDTKLYNPSIQDFGDAMAELWVFMFEHPNYLEDQFKIFKRNAQKFGTEQAKTSFLQSYYGKIGEFIQQKTMNPVDIKTIEKNYEKWSKKIPSKQIEAKTEQILKEKGINEEKISELANTFFEKIGTFAEKPLYREVVALMNND